MSHKYVYLFNEGNATMRNLLGGKGANLAEMTGLGLPVPYGFTVSTEACTRYYEDGRTISDDIIEQIKAALAVTEEKAGKKIRQHRKPLPRFRSFRRTCKHARHDGHDPQPRSERRNRCCSCKPDRQRAFCI